MSTKIFHDFKINCDRKKISIALKKQRNQRIENPHKSNYQKLVKNRSKVRIFNVLNYWLNYSKYVLNILFVVLVFYSSHKSSQQFNLQFENLAYDPLLTNFQFLNSSGFWIYYSHRFSKWNTENKYFLLQFALR